MKRKPVIIDCDPGHDDAIALLVAFASEKLNVKIDIITPNEVELTQLTGTTDIKDGANMLIEKGVSEVIVTLGEKGSYYTNGQEEIFSEAVPVNTIDSTAAGDSFNAAIAVALCENMNIKSALNFANIVGALTTTKMGAQDSLPYRDEVESFRIKLQK